MTFSRTNILLVLVAALLYLPFLDRAFHIDDHYFLVAADVLEWNPLFAEATDQLYMGKVLEGVLPYELTHPVGLGFALKIGRAIFGLSEIGLHVFFLIFPLIALVGMRRIVRCLFGHESTLIEGVLLLAMPVMLVSSQGFMADYPTVALLLFGAGTFLKAIDGDEVDSKGLRLGALSLTAAVFFSYQAAFLPPLLWLYARLRGKTNLAVTIAMVFPWIAIFTWLLLVYWQHDLFPVLASKIRESDAGMGPDMLRGIRPMALFRKALMLLAVLGANLALPLLWARFPRSLRSKSVVRVLGATVVLRVVLWAILYKTPDLAPSLPNGPNAWLYCCLLVLGVAALVAGVQELLALARDGKKHAAILLILWIVAVFVYSIAIMPFGAGRYLLPGIVPLFLLIMRPASEPRAKDDQAGLSSRASGAPRLVQPVLVALTLLFGLAQARADYEHAAAYQDVADRAVQDLTPSSFAAAYPGQTAHLGTSPTTEHTQTIWYVGEWGIRRYLDKVGAKYLLRENESLSPGDWIIAPALCRFWEPAPSVVARIRLHETWQPTGPSLTPLRLFNAPAKAGFYGDYPGLSPFAISSAPHEEFAVYAVLE